MYSATRELDHRPESLRDQHMALATIFAASLALSSLFVVIALRQWFGIAGFNPSLSGYLRSGGLALALILLPYLTPDRRHGLWGFAVLVLILAGLLMLRGAAMVLVDLACILVLFLALGRVWRCIRVVPRRWVAVMTGTGALAGALLVLVVQRHFRVLGPEQAMLGLLHVDTLFHVALAKLLDGYGVVTLGMDGPVPTIYHVLSHRVIAGYGNWTDADLLVGYGVFQSAIAVPVMLGLLLQAAAQLFHENPRGMLAPPAAVLSIHLWLAFGGVVMWHSYYGSESYALSLWFMIYALLLLQRITIETTQTKAIALHFAVALCIALAALAKISVGAVLACGVAAGLAAQSSFRPLGLIRACAFGLLPALAVYWTQPVAADGDEPLFKLFDFFRYAEPATYALLFAGVISFLSYRHWPADRSRQVLGFALLTGVYAGLCSSYLLNLPAGAHFYFSDPGSWMGLLVIPLLGLAPKWLLRRPESAQIVWAVVLLTVLLALHDRKLRGVAMLTSITETTRNRSADAAMGATVLTHTRLGQIWSEFSDPGIAFDAVHVSAEYLDFWNGHSRCWASSFVFPALFGRPMMAGLPPEGAECDITPYYGFSVYDLEMSRAVPDITPDRICMRAQQHGFQNILWVSADNAELLECPTNPA